MKRKPKENTGKEKFTVPDNAVDLLVEGFFAGIDKTIANKHMDDRTALRIEKPEAKRFAQKLIDTMYLSPRSGAEDWDAIRPDAAPFTKKWRS